jgi:hypothetical protein
MSPRWLDGFASAISDHSGGSGEGGERPGSHGAVVAAIMAPSGRVSEVGGVDWHRLGDGDSEAGRQAGVLDLLRRAQRELGGGPLTGTRFLYRVRDMLAATREIEAAVRGHDTTLYVGFQRADRLAGEAATYRDLVAAGVRVTAFGTGEPGPPAGVRWVRLPEDQAALQNQWLLVTERPEPIAFVGFETSEPDHFGRAEVTDPARTFAGFVTGDRRLVRAIAEHLEAVGRP